MSRIQTAVQAARKSTAEARETVARVCMFPAALVTTDVVVPALGIVKVSMVKGIDGELVATIEAAAGVRVTVKPTAANNNGATVRARKVG